MIGAWRAPPLARVGLRARAAVARGWARSAASEADSRQPAAESRQDSQYRDTVLVPRSRFPAQLPGRLQPEAELETQQVAAGAGPARPGGRVCVCVPGEGRGASPGGEARPGGGASGPGGGGGLFRARVSLPLPPRGSGLWRVPGQAG